MLKNDVGYLIKNINDKLKSKADEKLKQYHLTISQSRVLVYLRSKGGQATQKEIEIYLEVAHPTVVGLVSRMEQSGYVVCWPSDDGRNKNVKMTSKAEEIDQELSKSMKANEEMLLAPLSYKDRELLRNLLQEVADNLAK